MQTPTVQKIIIADDDIGHLGGISSAIHALSEGFRSRGIVVEYLSLHTPKPDAGLSGYTLEANRFQSMTSLHPLAKDFPGRWGLRLAAKHCLTPVWLLYRHLRLRYFLSTLGRDDAVISMKPRIGLLVESHLQRRRRSRRGSPYHAHQIHYSFDHWYRPIQDANVDRISRTCEALVTLWPSEAVKFGTHHRREAIFIPNAIQKPPTSGDSSPLQSKVVSCVTRLTEDKRVDLAIKAFDVALTKSPGWTMRIHGEGPERAVAEKAIQESIHSESITLGPRLTRTEVWDELANSELAILTSVAEGLPMSVLEAAVAGVPTVATASSTSVKDITSSYGYLCVDDSIASIANTLSDAMRDNRGRADKSHACRGLSEKFSVEEVVNQWIRLIEQRLPMPREKG